MQQQVLSLSCSHVINPNDDVKCGIDAPYVVGTRPFCLYHLGVVIADAGGAFVTVRAAKNQGSIGELAPRPIVADSPSQEEPSPCCYKCGVRPKEADRRVHDGHAFHVGCLPYGVARD